MFYWIGRTTYKARFFIVAVWVVIALVAAPLASQLPSELSGGGFEVSEPGESDAVAEIVANHFGAAPIEPILVLGGESNSVAEPQFVNSLKSVVAAMEELDFVQGVSSPLSPNGDAFVSSNKTTAYIVLHTGLNLDEIQNKTHEINEAIPSDLTVPAYLTGTGAIYSDITDVSESDLRRAELVTFPLALVALVLVFGSLIAAGLPLIMAAVSVSTTMAILYTITFVTDVNVFTLNTTSVLGLGVSIDYSLFVVSRFREELRKRDPADAIEIAMGTAGKAVFFSGLTVVIGLSTLLLLPFSALRSMGIGGTVVVAVSVLSAITLLPALMGILGSRVNKLSVLRRELGESPIWGRLAHIVMKRPIPIMLVVLVFLLSLGSPIIQINFGLPNEEILPANSQSRLGAELLTREFPESSAPIIVTVSDSDGIMNSTNLQELLEFDKYLNAMDYVTPVPNLTAMAANPQGQSTLKLLSSTPYTQWPDQLVMNTGLDRAISENHLAIRLSTELGANDAKLRSAMDEIRDYEAPSNLDIRVGGTAAAFEEFIDALYSEFPRAVLIVLAITYVVLVIMFSSIVLPIKAVLMNLLSITAAYGALVFVFQQGNFSNILNFETSGYVDALLPVLIFSILFGLSMDYEIFLLSRVRERYLETRDNTDAVASGLAKTGGIITGVAAILVIVAGSFTLADIITVKAVGLGIALAVAVDATVVRGLLVPSSMKLLGNWNWWAPKWLKRILPDDNFISH